MASSIDAPVVVHSSVAGITVTAGDSSAITVVPETTSLSTSTSTAGVRPYVVKR